MKNRLRMSLFLLVWVMVATTASAQGIKSQEFVLVFRDSTTGEKILGAIAMRVTVSEPNEVPYSFSEDCPFAMYDSQEAFPNGTKLSIFASHPQYRQATQEFVVGSNLDGQPFEMALERKPKVDKGILVEGNVTWRKKGVFPPCAGQSVRIMRNKQIKPLAETTTDAHGTFSIYLETRAFGKNDSLRVSIADGSMQFLPFNQVLDTKKSNSILDIRLQPQRSEIAIAVRVKDSVTGRPIAGATVRVFDEDGLAVEGLTASDGYFGERQFLPFDTDSLRYSIFKEGYGSMEACYPILVAPQFALHSDTIVLSGHVDNRGNITPAVILQGERIQTMMTRSNTNGNFWFYIPRKALENAGRLQIEALYGDRAGRAELNACEVAKTNHYEVASVIDPRSEVGPWRNQVIFGVGCAGIQRFQNMNLDNANAFAELLVAREQWKNLYFGARFGLGNFHYSDTITLYANARGTGNVTYVMENDTCFFPFSAVVKYGYQFRQFPWLKFFCGTVVSVRTQTGMLGVAFLPGRKLMMEVFGNATILNFNRPIFGFEATGTAKIIAEKHSFFGRAFLGTGLSFRL